MAYIVELSDAAQVPEYTQLRDVSLRRSLEARHGIFIAEGEKIIRRALDAGYQPRSFLLAERWLAGIAPLVEHLNVPIYLTDEQGAEQVTGFHVHRGALGAFEREERHHLSDFTDASRLVVCEDIVDHTNVGAIIRCAAGLGWDGVLLAPRAADPLYRRAIKTSMGASLSMPWARLRDWAHDIERLREAGFTVVAMALDDQAVDLDDFAASLSADARVAVLMGTEGDGLSSRWRSQADVTVMIPMARGIDSLNVAAATAVVCHTLRARD